MKVLMIDDSSSDRRLYRSLLEEMLGSGLQFWEATSAAQGIQLCRSVEPDCVLLDYRLPDMTGLEFLTIVRGTDPAAVPGFAIVMLAGLIDEQIVVGAMRGGAQDYLVKDGITPEGLMSAIQRATEKVGLIRALKQERDRLAASLAEKDVLLKEVHHRVKNNLQVVASLLRLQADSFSNPELEAALIESQNRVESMALVHEQLYATEDVREVDLAQHIEMLAANLLRGYGDPTRISVLADVQPVSLGINQAIPVSLILNELISNALKHAFPGGRPGSIRIEGRAANGRIFLAVRDDGRGMPESAESRRPKSLGLEIVKILTAQLKGEFEIDRSCGTSFRIAFPHHVN